jgi:hypothetical protein
MFMYNYTAKKILLAISLSVDLAVFLEATENEIHGTGKMHSMNEFYLWVPIEAS